MGDCNDTISRFYSGYELVTDPEILGSEQADGYVSLNLENNDKVLLGEKESYDARCRAHYVYDPDDHSLRLPIEEEVSHIAN